MPLRQKIVAKLCPRCRKEVEEDKKFCRYCGSSADAPKPVQAAGTIAAVSVIKNSERTTTESDSSIQEAERLISQGNFQEAISSLEKILKEKPDNNEAGLMHLLACVKLYNVYGYEKQIESLKGIADLSERERGLAREIFLLAAEESRKTGKEEKAREYRRLATRVILGQTSADMPSEIGKETPASETKEAQFPMPPERSSVKANRKEVRAPARQPRRITERQGTRRGTSRLVVSFALVLGLVGVLAAGMLGYYAKQKGIELTDLFPGSDKIAPIARETPPTDQKIAQVVGAEELGFKVWGTGTEDPNRQGALLREQIESQLENVRQLYRQEVQRKSDLMGSVTLQLTISPSGTVTRVDEFASRIKDKEFKKSVVDEAYNWRFPQSSSGLVKVNYPLLFAPAGMDVATLIKWEQGIDRRGSDPDEPKQISPVVEARKTIEPQSGPTYPAPVISSPPPMRELPRYTETAVLVPYEVLYPTSVFSDAREDSRRLARIEAGTKVNVASVQGDWLEVRSKQGRPPGFIKKDSAVPWGNR